MGRRGLTPPDQTTSGASSTTSDPKISSTDGGALGLVRLLASEIGPRRPCSTAERETAQALREWLTRRGVEPDLQPFRGYASFAHPFGAIIATALGGGLLQRRRPVLGTSLVLGSLATALLEGGLRKTPLSDLLSRATSANLAATIAPTATARQRVVLCGHMDSTRSGLMFHPSVIGRLPELVRLPGAASTVLAGWPLARRVPGSPLLRRAALGALAASLALLAERELRGVDVPGANDNASGTAVACQLVVEIARKPLAHTQVDLLITGCEESGLLGVQAYLRQLEGTRPSEPGRVVFVNFDSVGGDVPLTYILGEGTTTTYEAPRWLTEMLEGIARRRPELELRPARTTAGLPTDATPALARGYDAITLLAQGEDGIPNYHWPTDTFENVSPRALDRALEAARVLLHDLDTSVA